MALALIGVGLGALAHASSKAMQAPVKTQNLQYFNIPINMRATLGMANPGQAPTQSFDTGIMTEPNYTPAGRDQNQLLNQMTLQIEQDQVHYQQKMMQYWMNAGDNVVLPNAGEIVPILTNDHEVYSTAYIGRRNVKSANASARLVKSDARPVVGTQMGAANYAY